MTATPRVLAFAGSLRAGSFNKKLVKVAADAARQVGAEVTLIDLRDFPMPLYDGDIESSSGLPAEAQRLKALFLENDALLIASPEYNGSMTAPLKNALDWVSRREGDEPPLAAYRGKTAALVSASPGALGGIRSLGHVREVLLNMGVFVVPQRHALSRANTVFDDSGAMTDAQQEAAVMAVAATLVETTRKLLT
ncbi:MAG: FMN reductase [Rhodospirillaceae bacterium]|nr:FMN reductase [Rhodospirillaceae bacterium]